jgi:predicted transcriptional regulator
MGQGNRSAGIGTKDQVVAQYGRSSDEAAAVHLKKPEEYKKPTRTAKKNGDK